MSRWLLLPFLPTASVFGAAGFIISPFRPHRYQFASFRGILAPLVFCHPYDVTGGGGRPKPSAHFLALIAVFSALLADLASACLCHRCSSASVDFRLHFVLRISEDMTGGGGRAGAKVTGPLFSVY